ncbi:MAG TPA: periplasmic heavy metal sensor [Thermoanaerobaculia bacterium]|nr:periplasmic heavy metal sensor [Thermoanaerobaculia bacterium]
MTKRIVLCAALVLAMAGAISAAPLPPGKWWRRPDVAQRLALSEDQQTKLDTIFRGAASDLIDLRADAEKLSIAIRGELDQPQINRDALRKLANRLSDAQGKLFERELMMLVDMRSVLSDDQWARLRTELDRERPPREGRPMQRPRE